MFTDMRKRHQYDKTSSGEIEKKHVYKKTSAKFRYWIK